MPSKFYPKYKKNLLSQKGLGLLLARQGIIYPLDFQTFLRPCNVRPKLLESKAFAVLTIKLVQRKVKVGINKDMYCTVLLIGRFLMDYFTKGRCLLFALIFCFFTCCRFLYLYAWTSLYMDGTAVNFFLVICPHEAFLIFTSRSV